MEISDPFPSNFFKSGMHLFMVAQRKKDVFLKLLLAFVVVCICQIDRESKSLLIRQDQLVALQVMCKPYASQVHIPLLCKRQSHYLFLLQFFWCDTVAFCDSFFYLCNIDLEKIEGKQPTVCDYLLRVTIFQGQLSIA